VQIGTLEFSWSYSKIGLNRFLESSFFSRCIWGHGDADGYTELKIFCGSLNFEGEIEESRRGFACVKPVMASWIRKLESSCWSFGELCRLF
jgi:hypothetical protein